MIDLALIQGFEWDEGCARKNEKHGVTASEGNRCFSTSAVDLEDAKHSQAEPRFHALGMTHTARKLQTTFTVGGTRIRVISARDMHRKERTIYEQAP